MRLDVAFYRFQTFYTACTEGSAGVGEEVYGVQEVVNHHRFVHVEFEIPLTAAHGDGGMVSHDLAAHHCHRFGLGRVDFPRHDRGPRLVSRKGQLSKATSWSGTQPTNIVRDFHQGHCKRVQGARCGNDRIVSGQLCKLILCRTKGQSCDVGDFISYHLGEEGVSIESCSNCSAAESQFKQIIECKIKASKICVQLCNPSRCFLA